MFRSLRGRLIFLVVLLVAAAAGAGALMVGLFRQSATAQAGQAGAEIGRACDAIGRAYRFYTTGWKGPPPALNDEFLRQDLTAVVQTALRDRMGIEGGIWQAEAGSLAYAFPTYQGAEPKTDLPQAELPRIQAINRTASADDQQATRRYDASSQILLLNACPLPGPISSLTGWTMTRVVTFAGRGYQQLMAGLGILFATVLATAVLLTRLTMKWSRHVGQIETALRTHDVADLPILSTTGERELDRIVTALNEAGRRLATARQRADRLARQIATGERLAAIGRVAAGVAHEIRNPIAAMRLKAENALAGDLERKDQALSTILEQVERLDALLRRLLSVTERDSPRRECVALEPFLESCVAAHSEFARAKGITLAYRANAANAEASRFDPEQMRRALDNLVLNAIEAAPARSCVMLAARCDAQSLILSVHDEGSGPPSGIRDHLFEPFVTGRPDGTGLGLSIVREVAVAHGGTARIGNSQTGTTFEIIVPWQSS
jgi:signal transduction histidine kinase